MAHLSRHILYKILVLNNIIILSDDKTKGIGVYIVRKHVCMYAKRKQHKRSHFNDTTTKEVCATKIHQLVRGCISLDCDVLCCLVIRRSMYVCMYVRVCVCMCACM